MLANSPVDNFIDYFIHELSLVWGIVVIFAVIGLLLGRFLTRKGRREYKRYAHENRELLDQYRALRDDVPREAPRSRPDRVTPS